MRKIYFGFLMLTCLFFTPLLQAKTLEGVVRNVNHESSRSFGLDVPPLIRVYVNSGTKFKNLESFVALKVGDQVKVKGRDLDTGTFIATQVTVTGELKEVRDLDSNTLTIHLNQRFLMGVNQTAVLKQDNKTRLKLRSKEFINTLCKGGYDCSGEGELGMRLEIEVGSKKDEILLVSKNHRKPTSPVKIELHGYEFQLIEVGEDVVLMVVRAK